jgi:hypothetical protein
MEAEPRIVEVGVEEGTDVVKAEFGCVFEVLGGGFFGRGEEGWDFGLFFGWFVGFFFIDQFGRFFVWFL